MSSQSPRSGAVFPTLTPRSQTCLVRKSRNPLEAGLSFRLEGRLAIKEERDIVAIPSKRGCLSDLEFLQEGKVYGPVAIPSKRGCLSDAIRGKGASSPSLQSQSPRSGAVFPTQRGYRVSDTRVGVAIPSKRGCLSDRGVYARLDSCGNLGRNPLEAGLSFRRLNVCFLSRNN